MFEMIPLTVVSDIDRSTRSENGVSVGILETSGVRGAVFNLGGNGKDQGASL